MTGRAPRFLFAFPPVRDLLLRAKLLFIARRVRPSAVVSNVHRRIGRRQLIRRGPGLQDFGNCHDFRTIASSRDGEARMREVMDRCKIHADQQQP